MFYLYVLIKGEASNVFPYELFTYSWKEFKMRMNSGKYDVVRIGKGSLEPENIVCAWNRKDNQIVWNDKHIQYRTIANMEAYKGLNK